MVELSVPATSTPKFVLAVATFAKSDKLLDFNKLRLALPVTFPVTFPVRFASTVLATKVSLPIVHLSSVSFHIKVLFAEVPRSTSNPALAVGLPVSSAFKVKIASPINTVLELVKIVSPLTVKSPVRVKLAPFAVPVKVGLAKVLLDKVCVPVRVATVESIAMVIFPLPVALIPVPPVIPDIAPVATKSIAPSPLSS